MLVNGRDIQVTMYKNTGDNDFSTFIDITPYIKKDGISVISKGIDQVFKVDQSTLSLDCKNIAGSLWSFIDTNLETTNALFPPWILTTVDGKPYFLGLVNMESLTRDCKNESIKLTAQDWSKQLSNIFPSGKNWERLLSISSLSNSSASYTCISPALSEINHCYNNNITFLPVVNFPIRAKNKVYFSNLSTNILPDMIVSIPSISSIKQFTVSQVKVVTVYPLHFSGFSEMLYYINDTPTQYLEVTLEDGFEWSYQAGGDISTSRITTAFNVIASDTSLSTSTFEEILQDYTIGQDDIIHRVRIGYNGSGSSVSMINRIQVGDKVKITLSDQSLQETEIVAIDYFTKEYVLKDNLSGPTYKGANVYLNDDELKTIYYRNAKVLITNAVNGVANVDFSKLQKPTLSKYMFSALGTPIQTSEPTVITNINGTVTNNQLSIKAMKNIGPTLPVGQWTLDSDDNWILNSIANDTTSLLAEDTVNWTDQLLTKPSQFMINENYTLNPNQRLTNRNYMDWQATVDNGTGSYTSGQSDFLSATYIHDYSTLRRWKYSKLTDSFIYQVFNAGSYTTGISYGSSGVSSGQTIFSIDIFPAVPCSLGSGASLISVDNLGNLRVHCATSNYTLTDSKFARGIIRNTPYGTYIITKNGIGKIIYSSGSLSVSYCKIATDNEVTTLTLLPNMFSHLNNTTNYIIGIFTNNNKGTIETEARLLEIKSVPDTDPTITILSEEKVFNYVSSLGRMVYDPFSSRIFTLYDGRLYQISNKSSLIVERLKVEGMNSLELIEYISQILGAMAVPNPKGYLEIISIKYDTTATPIDVGIVEKSQSRLNNYFFSVVRVNGYIEDIYADAFGKEGTQSFEIGQHPLLFTTSQCAAVADVIVSFYGIPRREEQHTWKNINVNQFDDLNLFDIIKINGDSKEWYLLNITNNIIKQTAIATLLEK